MDIRKIVAFNIRTVRVEQGISQEKLAHEAGIDRGYMSGIERGEENFTIARLEAITTVLKVPPVRLFQELEKSAALPSLKAGVKPKLVRGRLGAKKTGK